MSDSLREQMLASAADAVNALCIFAQDQPMADFDAREERVLEVGRTLQATWLGQLVHVGRKTTGDGARLDRMQHPNRRVKG